ncbi:ATP-binding protein [Hymenobacter sp. 5317J-9]|uniref:sensor histidine kinase n=1 Tax=Hymenobacter sp. 5317J-9 TaxID=2932250 RepID=UPI001FD6F741|nr:ATP-binding protein [Hymenobacter sp. 5317J-9]UOQ98584.1 ATP-binding protein [Hymenobacter sp. 5317J-9]
MRLVLLLAALGLLFGVATAAPLPADTAVLRINRLPATGRFLLQKGWRYHAGDDPAWARPDFDDRAWDTLNPTRPRRAQPRAVQTGISWLRLRFRPGDSLRGHDLLVNFGELGAIEVYLNGQLVQRQGIINADPARVVPRGRFPQPGQAPAGGPAEQVLAVRYAPWQPPFLMGADRGPQLTAFLFSPQVFWQGQARERDNARIFLVLLGFSVMLALLHYAFYRYNPAQRANRYFARFALAAALASLGAYFNFTQPFDSLWTYLTVHVASNLLACMAGLWCVRALYALFHERPGRVYAGLWVWFAGAVLTQVLAPFHPTTGYLWAGLGVVINAEELRLTVRALRQRRRGAWIVAVGFAGGLLAALGYAGGILLSAPLLLQNLLIVNIFALPALGISLFLAREFALDAGLLQVKLAEVERLSAQTIAQEQEKQALLAQQNETLETQVAQRTGELQRSLTDLRATQAQLIQKEKMASLGELTAGIAHEIQNPLNFVNNFSEVSQELMEELEEEQAKSIRDAALEAELVSDLRQNLGKISHHGKRAAAIVKGMLEHSRTSTGERAPTDLNQLCEEYLRLAYQGLRAKDKTFNATLETDFAPGLPLVSVVGADVGRVLLNLLGNAFYAVQKRQQTGEAGYQPTVTVSTKQVGQQVEIRVADNGTGMPAAVQAKIFQPFFTTKPTGEGTGLGLSLSHDIIAQGHGGALTVASQEGKFTEFLISLPLN